MRRIRQYSRLVLGLAYIRLTGAVDSIPRVKSQRRDTKDTATGACWNKVHVSGDRIFTWWSCGAKQMSTLPLEPAVCGTCDQDMGFTANPYKLATSNLAYSICTTLKSPVGFVTRF